MIQLNANNECMADESVESGLDQSAKNDVDKDDESNGTTMDIDDESDISALSFCDGESISFAEDAEDELIGLDGGPTNDHEVGDAFHQELNDLKWEYVALIWID